MKSKRNSAYLFFIILLVHSVFSQDSQQEYNYSTIVESYGYADNELSEKINEIRELAYNDAKRNILDKTVVHVKSYSKVENFQLEYDLIQSETEGFLRILEKKDLGFNDDSQYEVWIKAEVIYNFKTEDDNPKQNNSLDEPLSVKMWTEKEKYTLKEKVRIFLLANKDCYINILYQDAENNVLQIFPNQHKKDNFIKAGKVYKVPDDSDPFELTVSLPLGEEQITIFASTSQLGESNIVVDENYFYKVKSDLKDYSLKTRGVRIEKKENPVEFFENKCTIIITEN